jgi:hypothetical protein
MTPETWVLAILGFIGSVLMGVLVFKGGREDRIDKRRSSEIDRLDGDVKELRADMDVVKKDSRLVAGVAIRAIRVIEQDHPGSFPMTDEELEAIERTRPVINPPLVT